MPKSTTFCNDLLKAIFQAVAIANLLDNAASAPLTNLEVALHTADPGIGGAQTTNEAAYTGYARVPVARTAGGWTVTGAAVENAVQIQFPQCTAAPTTVTHVSVGTAHAGAGKVLYAGELDDPQDIAVNVTPLFEVGVLDGLEA